MLARSRSRPADRPHEGNEQPSPLGVEVVGRGLAASGPRGPVFSRVDLKVPAGGLAVVHGPGGSGRSALLLALGGRMRLTAGELRVGDALADDGLRPLRVASAVARIHPGLGLAEGLRIRDLERQSVLASGGRSRPERITAAYVLVGVDPGGATLFGDLHPRDGLLVAVALAVAEHRPLVLVDDVELGLTAADLRTAWAALDAVADAGPTVIVSAAEPPSGVEHVAIALEHPTARRDAVARSREPENDDASRPPARSPTTNPAPNRPPRSPASGGPSDEPPPKTPPADAPPSSSTPDEPDPA